VADFWLKVPNANPSVKRVSGVIVDFRDFADVAVHWRQSSGLYSGLWP
jgi:hypothetical protein